MIKRISDDTLAADYVDGQTVLNTDLNKIISVCKEAINANYDDIQEIENGTKSSGNSIKFNGNTLSKASNGILSDNDTLVPSSKQVKEYIDAAIAALTS